MGRTCFEVEKINVGVIDRNGRVSWACFALAPAGSVLDTYKVLGGEDCPRRWVGR